MQKIIFHPSQLEFEKYPIHVASVATNRFLEASDIKEVRLQRWPLEIVTKKNEVLFVPAYYSKHLDLFVRLNSIPVIERVDIWSLLNEPFLDTELSEVSQQKTIQQLLESGFPEEEIDTIRSGVSDAMIRHNIGGMLWEWTHLGHYDTLVALGFTNKPNASDAPTKAYYDAFNEISNRGNIATPTKINLEKRIESKIYDLVCDMLPSKDLTAEQYKSNYSYRQTLRSTLTDLIISRYGEAHRSYHNMEHVLNVVEFCQNLRLLEPKNRHIPLRVAAWFHDIVYDPRSQDNEENSAELMIKTLGELVNPEDLEVAKSIIIMTKTPFNAHTEYEKVMFDADFSIFSEEQGVYQNYVRAIRIEYSHLSDVEFKVGRLEFINNIFHRIKTSDRFYNYLHPMHEAQLMKNISWKREELLN